MTERNPTSVSAPQDNGREDRIEIVDADPSWLSQFEMEASLLRASLPKMAAFRIEHFGSTAVPGLRAKPIIDIMVICPDQSAWPRFIDVLPSLGYMFWTDNPRKDRMFFVKGLPPLGSRRTHHLHVRLPTDAVAELRFRDALRSSKQLADRYAEHKRILALRYPTDREAYTEAKTEFVAAVLGDSEANENAAYLSLNRTAPRR
jgi:GrpB-like predicted nucleotidyltransferase (UPF0157 family)